MSGTVPQPTLTGFITFAQTAGVTEQDLDVNSVWYVYAFNASMEIVNPIIQWVSPTLYLLAVYNLAMDNLINFAQDSSGQSFFTNLRAEYGIGNWAAGVVQSTSDNGSSVGLLVADWMKTMTLSDLQNLKTPWGRQYLQIAQRTGTLWGLS